MEAVELRSHRPDRAVIALIERENAVCLVPVSEDNPHGVGQIEFEPVVFGTDLLCNIDICMS
jgi:hypothetical protein